MIKRIAGCLLFKFRNPGNNIGLNNQITRSCSVGKNNIINKSRLNEVQVLSGCNIASCELNKTVLQDNCTVKDGSKIYSSKLADHVFIGWNSLLNNVSIGRCSYLAGSNFIFNTDIGNFCSIAVGVTIGHAEHPLNRVSTSPVFYKSKNETGFSNADASSYNEFLNTVIENDVWIGNNAFIKTGITIGNGAVIGAGAVVTKDVAPYTIVGGVPASVIRKRFDETIIKKLQELKWWDWNEELLQNNNTLFSEAITIEKLNALKGFSFEN